MGSVKRLVTGYHRRKSRRSSGVKWLALAGQATRLGEGYIHVVLADSKRFGGWLQRGGWPSYRRMSLGVCVVCIATRELSAAEGLHFGVCCGTAERRALTGPLILSGI